jgi:hypothetical protein
MSGYDEVLDCIRDMPVKYQGDNLYRLLSFDEDGLPCDLDLSISSERLNQDHEMLSLIDALALMVSLALREYDHDYVAAKLSQVSRSKSSMPALIAETLIVHGGEMVRSEFFEGEEE